MPRLLVIDDDPGLTLIIRQAVEPLGIDVIAAATGAAGWNLFRSESPDVVVLDIMLPDTTGLELFEKLRGHDAKAPVIVLTARGTSSNAIEAMRLGAFDFLVKPVELSELRQLIAKAVEIRRLMQIPVEIREPCESSRGGSDLLVGRSPAMQEIYKLIGRIAARDVTVLISGETGTGKELVARAIYHYSARANKPFLLVDCSVGEAAVETELFGNERRGGANSERQRIGKIEQCRGGTILLDEVGKLPLAAQSKVLRWLQDNRFERCGGTETLESDARVIATTSEKLEELTAQGRFRPDLFYQLQGVQLKLPSLHERLEDLPALAAHFLTTFNQQFGKRVMRISAETLDQLRQAPWPGNVRELQSVIRQALAQATGAILLPDFLPAEYRQGERSTAATNGGWGAGHGGEERFTEWQSLVAENLAKGRDDLYEQAVQEMERHVLTLTLRHTNGNQAKAAKILGITRGNLRNKMRVLGIVIDKQIGLNEMDEETAGSE